MRRGNMLDPAPQAHPPCPRLPPVFPKESWRALQDVRSPLGRDVLGFDLERAEGSACVLPDGTAQLDLAPGAHCRFGNSEGHAPAARPLG